jgi:hypothetical protein
VFRSNKFTSKNRKKTKKKNMWTKLLAFLTAFVTGATGALMLTIQHLHDLCHKIVRVRAEEVCIDAAYKDLYLPSRFAIWICTFLVLVCVLGWVVIRKDDDDEEAEEEGGSDTEQKEQKPIGEVVV